MSDTQEPKPQKINRLDPAWAVFAAIFAQAVIGSNLSYDGAIQVSADFADSMLRERDRRDREEME